MSFALCMIVLLVVVVVVVLIALWNDPDVPRRARLPATIAFLSIVILSAYAAGILLRYVH